MVPPRTWHSHHIPCRAIILRPMRPLLLWRRPRMAGVVRRRRTLRGQRRVLVSPIRRGYTTIHKQQQHHHHRTRRALLRIMILAACCTTVAEIPTQDTIRLLRPVPPVLQRMRNNYTHHRTRIMPDCNPMPLPRTPSPTMMRHLLRMDYNYRRIIIVIITIILPDQPAQRATAIRLPE